MAHRYYECSCDYCPEGQSASRVKSRFGEIQKRNVFGTEHDLFADNSQQVFPQARQRLAGNAVLQHLQDVNGRDFAR